MVKHSIRQPTSAEILQRNLASYGAESAQYSTCLETEVCRLYYAKILAARLVTVLSNNILRNLLQNNIRSLTNGVRIDTVS